MKLGVALTVGSPDKKIIGVNHYIFQCDGKMNTTKKGDKLEANIYNYLGGLISNDLFWLNKDFCKIYLKKGYHSKDRNGKIVFDVAIEVFLPKQITYSLLILIECKNYRTPVPVDDAEEFYAKIQQISGANIKGIIASTNSFQKGTINFAKSKGIGLLRYFNRSEAKWILTRSPSAIVSNNFAASEWMTAYQGLTKEYFKSQYFDCYCFSGDIYTNSLDSLFNNLTNNGTNATNKRLPSQIFQKKKANHWVVEYKGKQEIEAIAQSILKDINYSGGKVSLESVCEVQHNKNNLKVKFASCTNNLSDHAGLLGSINFNPPEIVLYPEPSHNKFRQRFTLSHELGHFLLKHNMYMSGEYCLESDFDIDQPMSFSFKDISRMEWQANYFASSLLLPKDKLIEDFYEIAQRMDLTNRGFGHLYLDSQPCNLRSFLRVTDILKEKYGVSRTVVKIRLKGLDILKEPEDVLPK